LYIDQKKKTTPTILTIPTIIPLKVDNTKPISQLNVNTITNDVNITNTNDNTPNLTTNCITDCETDQESLQKIIKLYSDNMKYFESMNNNNNNTSNNTSTDEILNQLKYSYSEEDKHKILDKLDLLLTDVLISKNMKI